MKKNFFVSEKLHFLTKLGPFEGLLFSNHNVSQFEIFTSSSTTQELSFKTKISVRGRMSQNLTQNYEKFTIKNVFYDENYDFF